MAGRLVARFVPIARKFAPCARSSHGVSAVNNKLYVIGGEATARQPIDMAVHVLPVLEPSEDWRAIVHDSERSPSVRIAHTQAAVDDQLLIFGGRQGVDETVALNDMWSLDLTTEAWAPVEHTGEVPCPRSFHAATSVGSKMYVFGGCGESGRLADLHEYCSESRTWRRLPDAPVAGRGGAALEASSDGSSLWLLGGFAGHETNDLLRYDILSQQWRSYPSEWLRPRSVCASFGIGGSLFCFGGEVEPSDKGHEGAGGFADDLVAFDTLTGDPLPVKMVSDAPFGAEQSLPPARGWGGAAALSGSQAVLFGGLSGDDAAPVRLDDAWLVTLRLQAARAW